MSEMEKEMLLVFIAVHVALVLIISPFWIWATDLDNRMHELMKKFLKD